jgi:hypothetical protein
LLVRLLFGQFCQAIRHHWKCLLCIWHRCTILLNEYHLFDNIKPNIIQKLPSISEVCCWEECTSFGEMDACVSCNCF